MSTQHETASFAIDQQVNRSPCRLSLPSWVTERFVRSASESQSLANSDLRSTCHGIGRSSTRMSGGAKFWAISDCILLLGPHVALYIPALQTPPLAHLRQMLVGYRTALPSHIEIYVLRARQRLAVFDKIAN